MMIVIVGVSLILWFASLVFVYGLGARNEAWIWAKAIADGRVERGKDGTVVHHGNMDDGPIHYGDVGWHECPGPGCSYGCQPPPAPPADTDPGVQIKEGGWPPKR